jgi:uncharacterized protein with GYD domain
MTRFLMLLKFTEKGLAGVKDSPSRAAAFREAAAKAGATIEAQYWLLGEYDGVALFAAPDEATAVGLALKLGSLGNVRTCLARALDEAEFRSLLGKA